MNFMNMRIPVALCLTLLFPCLARTQSYVLISYFTWDANPVTNAAYGPNATSVSSSAGSSSGGVGGTNGLNARATGSTQDINLTLAGSPTFDLNGIDIWMDFQREESESSFYRRTGFNFGMTGGSISVSFRVSDGAGSYITVNSGSVYTVPNDDVFRTYRFFYNPVNGMAGIHVNGTSVWSYDGTDGRNMYWTGAGNVVVGAVTDGTGANETIMDNLRIYSVINSPLPVELLGFDANPLSHSVDLYWATASETGNHYFSVQRSANGTDFETIVQVDGLGTCSQGRQYRATDELPLDGRSYYRLMQTDFNGNSTYSDVVPVVRAVSATLYPNPCTGRTVHLQPGIPAEGTEVLVFNARGQCVYRCKPGHEPSIVLQLPGELPAGVYLVCLQQQGLPLYRDLLVLH